MRQRRLARLSAPSTPITPPTALAQPQVQQQQQATPPSPGSAYSPIGTTPIKGSFAPMDVDEGTPRKIERMDVEITPAQQVL